MAIAEDASTPAAVSSNAANSNAITTALFSPPANALLVALVVVGNASGAGVAQGTVSWASGGNGTWTNKLRQNPSTNACSEFWWCQLGAAPGASTVSLGVGSSTTTQPWGKLLAVRVITGAAALASQTGNSLTTAPSIDPSFTASQSGSLVYIASGTNVANYTETVDANTTEIANDNDATNGEVYVAGKWTNLSTLSAATIGWTNTSTVNAETSVLEIIPAGGAVALLVPSVISQYGSFH